jgi:hypothetical protein
MAACLGLLVLLIAAFALGRLTASPEAPTVTPKQTVIKRELGKFYMVIQALPGRDATSMAEAKRIAEFCTANGEPAQVQLIPGRTRGTGHLIVWSAKPFDAQQGVEVRAHALSLQNELGPKYAKRYGSQYKFTQPQRNGTLIPKMYQYTKRR